jgi:hypothetical protein
VAKPTPWDIYLIVNDGVVLAKNRKKSGGSQKWRLYSDEEYKIEAWCIFENFPQ